jgi:hypothetical protein
VEVLVVMAALAVATGLLIVALEGALKLEHASSGLLDGLRARHALADQFRADVARAADAPEHWQKEAAGPTCLILAVGNDRHVVYRWEAERLLRIEAAGKKAHRREVGLGEGATAVTFERSGAGGRLVTLQLFTVRKDGVRKPSAEITAALGGDLQ